MQIDDDVMKARTYTVDTDKERMQALCCQWGGVSYYVECANVVNER